MERMRYTSYVLAMAHEFGDRATAARVCGLSRIAKQLQKYSEIACNTGLTLRQERHVDRLKTRAREIAQGLGVKGVIFNGDPRGMPLFLECASGYSDDWARRGLTVQW